MTFLVGKTIKAVYPKQDEAWSVKNYAEDEHGVDCSAGVIILEFTDGTVVEVWNSEWGGIRIAEQEEVSHGF